MSLRHLKGHACYHQKGKAECRPSLLKEFINRGPNTSIPTATTVEIICWESKDPNIEFTEQNDELRALERNLVTQYLWIHVSLRLR